MLCYVYNLLFNVDSLDMRDINTRRHDWKLFIIPKIQHYTGVNNQTYTIYNVMNGTEEIKLIKC